MMGMTCRTATRELSAPSGRLSPAELRGHLAACPTCAARADGLAKLDRIWDETRPEEPPAAAWDALWADVVAAGPPALRVASATDSAPRRGARVAGWAALGLAQAAAVVLAVVLSGPDRVADAKPPVHIEVAQGEMPFLRISPGGDVLVEMRESPDFESDFFNLFEPQDN